MNRALPTDSQQASRHVVRDAADINRLIIHLFTRWTLPHVEIRIDSLPAVVVQRAQHHFARISESRNGALGAGLAATAFLAGTILLWASPVSMIWTSRQLWQHLGLLGVATLYAGLIGAGAEFAWTRLKLMMMLRRLRRLAEGRSSEEPARYMGRVAPVPAMKMAAVVEDEGSAHDDLARSNVRSRPRRTTLLLHDTADFKRLIIHLFTHLKLPIVKISVEGVATLDVQRAQHRIVRLSEACNCVLGALLAAATILGGVFSVQWISSHNWNWMVPDSWGPLAMVPVAALCAALTGWAIEMVWIRVRLMLVLRGVRHRLGA